MIRQQLVFVTTTNDTIRMSLPKGKFVSHLLYPATSNS